MKNTLFILIVTIAMSLFVFNCGGNDNTAKDKTNTDAENVTNNNNSTVDKKIENKKEDDGLIWLVGNLTYGIMQRMMADNGLDALVREQNIAGIGMAFMFQRKDLIDKDDIKYPAVSEEPGGQKVTLTKDNFKDYGFKDRRIFAVRGKFVTDKIKAFVYDQNPNGGRPTSYHHEDAELRYFLAEDTVYISESVVFKLEGEKLNITIDSSSLPVDIDKVNINLISDLEKPADNTKEINLKKGEKKTFTTNMTKEESEDSWLMITNTKINSLYTCKVKEEDLPKYVFFFGLRPMFVNSYYND